MTCGDVIGPNEVVRLTADLEPCSDLYALTVRDHSRLILNGYTVRCPGDNFSNGILMSGTNAWLEGPGIVRNCDSGVLVEGDDNIISRVTVRNNMDGIVVESDDNRLSRINAWNNGEDGIFIDDGSDDNRLSNIRAWRNKNDGIVIQSDDNRLFRIRSTSNGDDGIQLFGDDNTVRRCIAARNGEDNISIDDDASGNRVSCYRYR